jgi:ribonucleoside-diphosphate reductase alpha chain
MEPELSTTAEKIFKLKYSRDSKEDWEGAVARVALYVAQAEDEEKRLFYTSEFCRIIYEKSFLPGGRILANAGTGVKNLMNCFVLPVEDSREGIYGTLKDAAEVFAWGGGVGYNFSKIRAEGSFVKTTKGKASGPLSFMSLYDQTGEVISQASRRGAQMGILNVEHPDIVKFINFKNKLNSRNTRLLEEYKRNLGRKGLDIDGELYFHTLAKTLADDQLTHFNVSVGVSDAFMEQLGSDSLWDKTHTPDQIMRIIATNAWLSGDPGIFFIDRANGDNMVPYLGKIEATNPCGEVPLLSYEACCLGSINLSNFNEGDVFDWNYLAQVVHIAVRFLDDVQELNETPVEKINDATRATRRLGLGVMGLADLLAERNLLYDSDEAREFCDTLAWFIGKEAWLESMSLAEEKGAFPAFDPFAVNWKLIDKFNLERRPVRNVAITSIAPTGTIALVADVNSGIEPYFAHSYSRNLTEGVGNTATETIEQSAVSDTVKTAHEISWQDHIKMQEVWQRWTDNAVSKTINMHNDASIDDIINAYNLAWKSGLKGMTVYRDGSKLFQILNK